MKDQLTANEIPDIAWDVAIVGAGPAGSTAALNLASKGHRVLLLDKQRFPREKTCGDALLADAVESLKRSGLYEEVRSAGREIREFSIFSPSGYEVRIPGYYLTLQRQILDTILVSRAVSNGSAFAYGAVSCIKAERDGSARVDVAGRDQPVRAKILIVATGASLNVLKQPGMILRSQPDAVALRCYVQSTLEMDRMVFCFDKSTVPGYGWIFPLTEGVYNIGCGVSFRYYRKSESSLKELFAAFCSKFPPAKQLLARSTAPTPIRGSTLRYGLDAARPVGPGNILAAGETLGATYPFSGEGIGKAMETAEIAAEVSHEALTKSDTRVLQDYGPRLKTQLKFRYRGYYAAEKWLSKPWFCDFLAIRANRSKFLQTALEGITNETIDPRSIFSFRGILRSLME